MAKARRQRKKVNTYEAMFLLGAGHASDLDNAVKLVRGIIERHEGKIIVLKKWDERKLAYEIRSEKRGLYIIAFFTAPPQAVSPIVRDVELSDDILRVIVTKADHLNAEEMAAVEPQPIIPREERSGWDRPPWEERSPAPLRRERPGRSAKSEEPTEISTKE